jgi:hypothetical protein
VLSFADEVRRRKLIRKHPRRTDEAPYGVAVSGPMRQSNQDQIEAAVEQTLAGWGAELDTGRKFWSMDWNQMMRDVITALRSGEPVLYDDD